jgi:hypothetical protein
VLGNRVRTAEETESALASARIARAAKNAARKASTLRKDFLDQDHWEDLAREKGLRLPQWGDAPTVSNMRTWLHKVGMSQAEWETENGCRLAQFPVNNPDWPLRAFAGLTLELIAERR